MYLEKIMAVKKETKKKRAWTLAPKLVSPSDIIEQPKKSTDWSRVKSELKKADDSLLEVEIDFIISVLRSPRRLRSTTPHGWLSPAVKNLVVS
jgi:hypothetical protein